MLDIQPPVVEPKYRTMRRLTSSISKLMLNMAQRQAQSADDKGDEDGKKSKWRSLVEVLILCILIFIVWSLLLIPIIFYYIPLPKVSIIYCNIDGYMDSVYINIIIFLNIILKFKYF